MMDLETEIEALSLLRSQPGADFCSGAAESLFSDLRDRRHS
jgi:hypothetical protein